MLDRGGHMQMTETLHARPEPGQDVSPCCGRTLAELPRYDRIAPKPDMVTCGRLSDDEVSLLSGQPVISDPYDRQVVCMMTSTVCRLLGDSVTSAQARERIDEAIRQVVPHDKPLP